MLVTMWLRAAALAAAKDGILYNYSFVKVDSAINDMTALFQSGCRLCFVPMPFPYAQVRTYGSCHSISSSSLKSLHLYMAEGHLCVTLTAARFLDLGGFLHRRW